MVMAFLSTRLNIYNLEVSMAFSLENLITHCNSPRYYEPTFVVRWSQGMLRSFPRWVSLEKRAGRFYSIFGIPEGINYP